MRSRLQDKSWNILSFKLINFNFIAFSLSSLPSSFPACRTVQSCIQFDFLFFLWEWYRFEQTRWFVRCSLKNTDLSLVFRKLCSFTSCLWQLKLILVSSLSSHTLDFKVRLQLPLFYFEDICDRRLKHFVEEMTKRTSVGFGSHASLKRWSVLIFL